MTDYVYDCETYPNMFSIGFLEPESGHWWIFEISDRRNQIVKLLEFLHYMKESKSRGVGFNNEHFDYPILHMIWNAGVSVTPQMIFEKASAIIHGDSFEHTIWPDQRIFPQVDLFKIHHFDNRARSTSLKKLEINMRSASVVDLPYKPGVRLSDDQKDVTIGYMCHDISETARFLAESKEKINFRDDLAEKYPDLGDVVNFNDTKIGKKFFELKLEKSAPGICYERVGGRRSPRQTHRAAIHLNDVILPYIEFKHPEFQRVLSELKNTTIVETKGALTGLYANIGGFHFVFGTGGIHGSLDDTIVRSDGEYQIIDVDVASYYPNLAISNGFYPEHLSETFCSVYSDLYQMRRRYPKNTSENAMLKLALNGVYGDSNNIYSPFYDPKYTMSITINGQLLLCMLAEWLLEDGVSIIQANTDGLTMRVRRDLIEWFNAVCAYWQEVTGLTLEFANYDRMIIRDVNNYIAVKADGSRKRIGDYTHQTTLDDPYTRERQWHSHQNALVAPKAAEAFLVDGVAIDDFVKAHRDPFDFMSSIKVQRSHELILDDGSQIQKTCRYYISTVGQKMFKIMPPLAANPTKIRKNAVEAGWKVKVCNDASDFDWSDLNWLYYIEEAKKLVSPVIRGEGG